MKKTVIVIMSVLAIVIALTAYLNKEYASKRADIHNKAGFLLKENGSEVSTLLLDDIRSAGAESFKAVLKTSGKEPEYHNYEGTQLKNLIKAAGIELSGKTTVIVTAVDGYSIAYPVEDILSEKNAYLSYASSGELLKKREEGGRGPYQVIILSDKFSNRRCKHAVEMDVR
ncbi:MAG: hypothetical protein WC212_06660 [Candidatus Delongbacteria bacterium]